MNAPEDEAHHHEQDVPEEKILSYSFVTSIPRVRVSVKHWNLGPGSVSYRGPSAHLRQSPIREQEYMSQLNILFRVIRFYGSIRYLTGCRSVRRGVFGNLRNCFLRANFWRSSFLRSSFFTSNFFSINVAFSGGNKS